MTKRARYDGPHEAVQVHLDDGRVCEVQRGHQLPTEVDGEPVAAAVRDSLLERDDWSVVEQKTDSKKEG